MKIRAPKEDLLKAVQTTQNVVSSKSTLPILSNILIEATKDTMRFTATDLDMGISYNIQADVKEEGATTVPAKRFTDIIKELPDSEVTINAKRNIKSLFLFIGNLLILLSKIYHKKAENTNKRALDLQKKLWFN